MCIGDNYYLLLELNTDSVDLIVTDPPFNSNRDYKAPIGSKAANAAFSDMFDFDDITETQMDLLYNNHVNVVRCIMAGHNKSMQAYLTYMAIRLIEMERVLKPNGSILLHCDDNAVHYLKLLMDAIFGTSNFRNDLIRVRSERTCNGFGRVHDNILFYAGKDAVWNKPANPRENKHNKAFNKSDDRGRYALIALDAPGESKGRSGKPWRGHNPTERGRHWSTPVHGGMCSYIQKHNIIPGWPDAYKTVHDKLDALDDAGLIEWTGGDKPLWGKAKSRRPWLKRYAKSAGDVAVNDVLVDFRGGGKTEYPTEKPLPLLKMLIKATSNPGDVVLDPFCGGGTSLVAASILDRQFIGMDVSKAAYKWTNKKLAKENEGSLFDKPMRMKYGDFRRGYVDTPKWTEYKQYLYSKLPRCYICLARFKLGELQREHIIPTSKGGADKPHNWALACGPCNRAKGIKSVDEAIVAGGHARKHAKKRKMSLHDWIDNIWSARLTKDHVDEIKNPKKPLNGTLKLV